MADKPINFSEHVQLTNVGISAESISFANVTLESENFVCVRESVNGQNSVVIVNLNDISDVYVLSPLSRQTRIETFCCSEHADLLIP